MLARGTVQLIESGSFGTYHLTDRTDGGISWFTFAQEVFKLKGLDNRVEPATAEEFDRPARRPAYSVLDTSLFTQRSGYEPMPWQDALKHFIDTVKKTGDVHAIIMWVVHLAKRLCSRETSA